MNTQKYIILFLISVLVSYSGYSQKSKGEAVGLEIEDTIAQVPNYDLLVEVDYVDEIELGYWDKDSIKVNAYVNLIDGRGKSRNNYYMVNVNNDGGRHNIIAKLTNFTAHYVQKIEDKYSPNDYKKDSLLKVGTRIAIMLPKKMNVEFKGQILGDMKIDHNGGGLLASTYGNIHLNIHKKTKADLLLSSLFGQVLVDEHLNIKETTATKKDKGFKVLKSQGGNHYLMNGGNGVVISLISYGSIKIQSKSNSETTMTSDKDDGKKVMISTKANEKLNVNKNRNQNQDQRQNQNQNQDQQQNQQQRSKFSG